MCSIKKHVQLVKLPTRSQTRKVKFYSIESQNQVDFCFLICFSFVTAVLEKQIQKECDLRNRALSPFVTLPPFVSDSINAYPELFVGSFNFVVQPRNVVFRRGVKGNTMFVSRGASSLVLRPSKRGHTSEEGGQTTTGFDRSPIEPGRGGSSLFIYHKQLFLEQTCANRGIETCQIPRGL
jgi:hypothetical protein